MKGLVSTIDIRPHNQLNFRLDALFERMNDKMTNYFSNDHLCSSENMP